MDQVVATYPTLAAKSVLQGTLFEGQKQYVLHITKDVASTTTGPRSSSMPSTTPARS